MTNQSQELATTNATMQDALKRMENQFIQIVDDTDLDLNWKNELGFALQAINKNNALSKCSTKSLQAGLVNIAMSGLSLNPVLGYCYLIPRGGEAILDVSYRGMIKIVTDSLSVTSMDAAVVYSNDVFEYEKGSNSFIRHIPTMEKDRGEKVGAYAIATLHDKSKQFEILRSDEIEAIKAVAKAKNIWDGDFADEMWKKSAIKRLFKYLPKTDRAELAANVMSIDNDNHVDFEAPKANQSSDDNVDTIFEEVEIIDAEVVEEPTESEDQENK